MSHRAFVFICLTSFVPNRRRKRSVLRYFIISICSPELFHVYYHHHYLLSFRAHKHTQRGPIRCHVGIGERGILLALPPKIVAYLDSCGRCARPNIRPSGARESTTKCLKLKRARAFHLDKTTSRFGLLSPSECQWTHEQCNTHGRTKRERYSPISSWYCLPSNVLFAYVFRARAPVLRIHAVCSIKCHFLCANGKCIIILCGQLRTLTPYRIHAHTINGKLMRCT